MPVQGSIKSAKEMENYFNGELTEKLKTVGLTTAGFERIFRVRQGEGKKPKPDISFTNGGVHLISGKFGEHLEKKAYTTADEYKEDLKSVVERHGEKLGEVFAVSYPSGPKEKFHLHILPKPGRGEISLTLDSLDEVATEIKTAVDGLIADVARKAEPVLDEAKRLLRWGAEDLAQSLRGVKQTELEEIFGGHGFFRSVLQAKLPGDERAKALRTGVAYLFVNQALFYVLLSQAAERAGDPGLYPRINPDHFGSPKALRDEYFTRVRAKNYEPIYGFDVARFFRGRGAAVACEEMVRGIVGLAPKLNVPDLVGQIFQGLIPFGIRKPLGAHYTNPKAAKLLATLSIDSANTDVLDPACGSGTLLVASYQRKMALAGERDRRSVHRRFVEEQITGLDAMAFAAHLAAVNLALQEPLLDTDHVRIGTTDSTRLRPGDEVIPTEEALPTELHQGTLMESYERARKRQRKGPVQMTEHESRPIKLRRVDLVIMNPPFTSRDNMAKEYRDLVDRRFSEERYRDAISGKKISQQAYFLLLADRFLSTGGRIAAVLPMNTFVGFDYWPLLDFLLREYRIEFLIAGLGKAAFSEDTSLSECLLIASKGKPDANQRFRLVGTIKPPLEWESDEPAIIADAVAAGHSLEGLALVREFSQTALAPSGGLLSDLVLKLVPEYDSARNAFEALLIEAVTPLIAFSEWRTRGVTYQDRIEPVRHLTALGASALLAVRSESHALKKIDRLVYVSEQSGLTTFRDRNGGAQYRFPDSSIQPAVRRMAYFRHIDVSGETDFCVADPGAALEKAMESMYGPRDSKRILAKLRGKNFWKHCCEANSSRVLVARRVDLASPGTTLMCCRSDVAAFNVTNFAVKNFKNELQEKLFCLWMNSSIGLLQLVAATPTRGSWVGIQRNIVDKVRLPDFDRLSASQKERVQDLWNRVRASALRPILEQLEREDEVRKGLDEGLLELLGISDPAKRTEIGRILRAGVAASIRALKRTMGNGEEAAGNEDEVNDDVDADSLEQDG